ncbi:tetratricopeptide repeat protein [Ekhidna sp.]
MKEEENILRFLEGKMDAAEQEAFAQRITLEEELRESVEHSRKIKNILDEDTIEFSNNVRSVIESKRKPQSFKPLLIAASISAILAVSIYLLFFDTLSVEERAVSYLEPYPDVITSRAETNPLDLSSYNSGNYEVAIESLENIFNKEKEPVIALYLGVSYLMINDAEKALSILQSMSYQNTIYKSDFVWYQSLALINLGRYSDAEKALKNLRGESQFYSGRASKLLDDLE